MKRSLIIIVVLFTNSSFGQDADSYEQKKDVNPYLNYKYGAKLYSGLNIRDNHPKSYALNFSLSPTFQWKNKRNNFQEIGINDIILRRSQYNRSFNLSVRYEYIINFMKHRKSRFVPSIGMGIMPYISTFRNNPYSSNHYGSSGYSIGANLFAAPHLTYYFSKKFFVDVSIPIHFMGNYYTSYNDNNPSLTSYEQRYSTLNYEFNPEGTGIRLGIGVKF